jgi:hypothetical protein
MNKPWYIAGPMTGYPKFNFPLFNEVATSLRSRGWNIISPHELDEPEIQEAAWNSPDGKLDDAGKVAGHTWGEILARDVRHVADDAQGVILLPMWWQSRGARLEAFVAVLCNKPVLVYNGPGEPTEMPKANVLENIRFAMEGP